MGFEYFEYFGPVDTVTRDFCRARAGRVYTRDEIDRMDNGHMPNVMQTGGGHRCRHHWRPVRRDWFSDEEWGRMSRAPMATVADVDIDMETQWDREHRLDYDELAAMTDEQAAEAIRDWTVELLDAWNSDEFGTPETRAMRDLFMDWDLALIPHMSRAEFDAAALAAGMETPEDLLGFQDGYECHFVIEGHGGLLSTVTHEAAHVLDYWEDEDFGGLDEGEADLTAQQALWEYERRAWLVEEEFRLVMGEEVIWPNNTGGIDHDAMFEWIKENY